VCTVADHPHPILTNAPLQTVVCELRFPAPFLVTEDLRAIRSALKDYPLSDTQQGIGIELNPESGVRQQPMIQRHLFSTLDESHQVSIGPGSLALEARSGYEGFKRFLERWLQIVGVVQSAIELTIQTRLGLRYVNQLLVEDASAGLAALSNRVNAALLSPFGSDGFPYHVTTSFEEMRLRDESLNGTLRHGLQLAAPVQAPGAPPTEGSVTRGFYALDIDFYDDQRKTFAIDDQKEQLKAFNHSIWNIFRWAVTDEEYARMEPRERDETS